MKKNNMEYTKQNAKTNKENKLRLQCHTNKHRLYQSWKCIKEKEVITKKTIQEDQ